MNLADGCASCCVLLLMHVASKTFIYVLSYFALVDCACMHNEVKVKRLFQLHSHVVNILLLPLILTRWKGS